MSKLTPLNSDLVEFGEVLQRETREIVAIAPTAAPVPLARVLMDAAREPVNFALDTLDRWWAVATPPQRQRLVLALARALPDVDGASAHRLANPRWQQVMGVPLWLATFALTRRLQRQSRPINTLAAWANDWRTWRRWCKRHRLPSFNPSARQIDRFLRDFAPNHKLSTTRRWGSSLTAMHRAAGLPDPLENPITAEIWKAALRPADPAAKGLRRRADDDKRRLPEQQAEGLTRDLVDHVLVHCDQEPTLIARRDAALIAVAYDLLARRSEAAALQVADIEPAANGDGSGVAHIRRSKTDQEGAGEVRYLRPDTMSRIGAWIEASGLQDGALFRSLRGYTGRTGVEAMTAPPLPAADVLRILRRRVARVDPTITGISGHSARVGAAQDLSAAGTPDSAIASAGRWKSVTQVMRYTRKQAAQRGGMAQLAREQSKK
ncbi:MAG: tyrosine-type recombinase/integrase [Dokdonella sp.]